MPATQRPFAQLSDEAVLDLLAHANEGALAELYDRYGRAAYSLSLRVLRDRALAEDAVQEGFLSAWRSAAAFDPARAKPSTWLLTLVHRRAVDLVRREERRRGDPLPEEETAQEGTAEDEASLREQRAIVQEALGKLPPDQRAALELAYYGGYTQSELAERLGVPLGTVKSRMFAGLRRLRELLAEAGLEPS